MTTKTPLAKPPQSNPRDISAGPAAGEEAAAAPAAAPAAEEGSAASRKVTPLPTAERLRGQPIAFPVPDGRGPAAQAPGAFAIPLGSEEMSPRSFFRLLRRQLLLIVVVGVLLIAALLPPIMAIERVYSAQTRLLIHRPAQIALVSPDSPTFAPVDLLNEIERLYSPAIAAQVIKDMRLDQLEEFNPPPEESLMDQILNRGRALLGLPPVEVSQEQDDTTIVERYLAKLGVWRNSTSDVISISFSSEDPELAADIVNHMVEVYVHQRSRQTDDALSRAERWLQTRIAQQQSRIDGMTADADRLREASGSLGNEDVQTQYLTEIATLSGRLAEIARTRARLETIRQELGTDGAAAGEGTMADDVIAGDEEAAADDARPAGTPLLADLARDLQAQQRTLAQLTQTFGDNHAEVIKARAVVAEIQQSIDAEVARQTDIVRGRLAALDGEEAEIRSDLQSTRQTMAEMAKNEAVYQVAAADLAREREALASLEDQLRTLQSEATLPATEVEILAPAVPPHWPDGRSKRFYLMAAVLGSLVFAVTAACLRELMDGSVRSQQQFRNMPRVMPGGLLPRLPRRARHRLVEWLRENPDGLFADGLHWLQLAIERSGGGALPRSLLVTSAVPGEGKTLVSVALGATLAAKGHRILLVDADLRQGSLHRHFGGTGTAGLADVLAGRAPVESVIRIDPDSGLEFMTCGVRAPGEVLDPRRLREILDMAAATDRVVIFDAAPILASAEAAHLATLTGLSVLVGRWGRTPLRVARLAAGRLLDGAPGDVVVALNVVRPRRHARYSFDDSDFYGLRLRHEASLHTLV